MVQKIKVMTAIGGAVVAALALNMIISPYTPFDIASGSLALVSVIGMCVLVFAADGSDTTPVRITFWMPSWAVKTLVATVVVSAVVGLALSVWANASTADSAVTMIGRLSLSAVLIVVAVLVGRGIGKRLRDDKSGT